MELVNKKVINTIKHLLMKFLFSKVVILLIDKVKQVDSSVSSTPSALKKTLKSELKGKQPTTVSLDEKDIDDEIEILDDDDDDDESIRFDMKALSLGLEDESKTSSSKTATSVKSVVNKELPSNTSKSSLKTLS